MLKSTNHQIRTPPCPVRKVRSRSDGIDLIFRALPDFAQKKLARPCELLSRLGEVKASRIAGCNVSRRDVVSRRGRDFATHSRLRYAILESKVLVASQVASQRVAALFEDQLEIGITRTQLQHFDEVVENSDVIGREDEDDIRLILRTANLPSTRRTLMAIVRWISQIG